jgi:hypothetical protein
MVGGPGLDPGTSALNSPSHLALAIFPVQWQIAAII